MPSPVQWEIVLKLRDMAKTILKSNGFYTDVLEVNTEDVSPENIDEFPCINILTGVEEYLNPTQSESGKLVKTFNVKLDCFFDGSEDGDKRQELTSKLLSDLELKFFNDADTDPPNGVYAYNLEGKALIAIPVRSIPFNVASDNYKFGIELEMQIHYRQKRSDPNVLAS